MSDLVERLRSENELYAAEMSAAREAGFYSAQELFAAYAAPQQDAQDALRLAKKALEMAWSMEYVSGMEARRLGQEALAAIDAAIDKELK